MPIPIEQLRADYSTLYRVLNAERAMRAKTFARDPQKLAVKIAEIDRALAAADRLKDAAKAALLQQGALLSPPVDYP